MARPAMSSMCRRCQSHFFKTQQRSITSTASYKAPPPPPRNQQSTKDSEEFFPSSRVQDLFRTSVNESQLRPQQGVSKDEPYHLNVYSHKQNTHITFTEPSRDIILSYSCGNIGLRKAAQKTFDASYQLSSFMFRKMAETSWKIGGKKASGAPITLNHSDIRSRRIEVVLRGYGVGREAFQKAILGPEGKLVKNLVCRVTDSTRLKFGGARSPQVRRLG